MLAKPSSIKDAIALRKQNQLTVLGLSEMTIRDDKAKKLAAATASAAPLL